MTKGVFVHSGSDTRFFTASSVYREPKAWGEEQWIVNKEYCGKKLILKKNRRCSMHLHKEKDEVFYLQSGKVLLEVAGETYTMMPGDYAHIPPGMHHRFTGLEDSEIIEFSTEHHEDDSYRRELSGHAEPERYARQSALLKKFPEQQILVVGDVMLDCYTEGLVERISPEAPVPIVSSCGKRFVPGGAGNVGANISALKGKVCVFSVCGDDAAGEELRATFAKHHIPVQFVIDPSRKTTVKERVVDRRTGQQIVRIDTEDTHPIGEETERKLLALLAAEHVSASARAILLSDYAKGVLTPRIFDRVYHLAERHRVPVFLDPKPHGISYISHLEKATVLTPNVREARVFVGEHPDEEHLGIELSRLCKGIVLLTRGAQGIDVCSQGKRHAHFDSVAREVTDVSGAGDTVLAVAALCSAAGGSLEDAADIANRAAGVSVEKQGTATLSLEELDAVL